MRVGQAQLGLHAPLEGGWWVLGEASVRCVDAVDRHPTFAGEPEERADAIHGVQDNKRLAGRAGEANTIK